MGRAACDPLPGAPPMAWAPRRVAIRPRGWRSGALCTGKCDIQAALRTLLLPQAPMGLVRLLLQALAFPLLARAEPARHQVQQGGIQLLEPSAKVLQA